MASTWLHAEIARLEQELKTCYLGVKARPIAEKVEEIILKALVQHKQFLTENKDEREFSIQNAHKFNDRYVEFRDERDLVGTVFVPSGSVAYVLTMFLKGVECVLVVAWYDKSTNEVVIQVCYDGVRDNLFAATEADGTYCGRHSEHDRCKFYRFHPDKKEGAAPFPGHGLAEIEDGRSPQDADVYFAYNNGIAQTMAYLWREWRDDPPVAGAAVYLNQTQFLRQKKGKTPG
jgi:hypothetical protein